MHYADFWRRLAAYLRDVVTITLVVAGVFAVFFGFDDTVRVYLENRSPTNRFKFLAERNQIRDVSFLAWLIYSMVLDASAPGSRRGHNFTLLSGEKRASR